MAPEAGKSFACLAAESRSLYYLEQCKSKSFTFSCMRLVTVQALDWVLGPEKLFAYIEPRW